MTKPTAELACRDMVTGLRITVDGSVQKVEMPKNAILASANKVTTEYATLDYARSPVLHPLPTTPRTTMNSYPK